MLVQILVSSKVFQEDKKIIPFNFALMFLKENWFDELNWNELKRWSPGIDFKWVKGIKL